MADEILGGLKLPISGDYSQLLKDWQTVQGQAQQAGQQIAQSFNSGVSSTGNLEAAISSLTGAITQLTAKLSGTAAAQDAAAGATQRHTSALHGQVSEIQAVSGAIRVFEGGNALRAVERFVAGTLGLGPALQAIFPIVGAIAFGEQISRLVQAVTEFYERVLQGRERASGEFRELNRDLETSIDEIQLANDKLDNQIAKLTGKHENALKEMIDEAALAVDKLSAKLDTALGKLAELNKKEEIGLFEALLSGQGVTNTGSLPGIALFGAKKPGTGEVLGGKSGVGGAREDIDQIKDRARTQIEAARQTGDLQAANNALLKARNDIEFAYGTLLLRQQDEVSRLQALQTKGFADETKNIEVAKKTYRDLIDQRDLSVKEFEGVGKKQTVTGLQAGKSDARTDKKAAEDWLNAQREQLAFLKSQDTLTVTEEKDFWNERLETARSRGAAYVDVVRKILMDVGNLHQQQVRAAISEGAKADQQTFKDLQDQIREAEEAARQAGGHPAATKLSMLQDLAGDNAPDTGLDAGVIKQLREQLPAAQKAADAEATAELKRFLNESDEAWMEAGVRNAQQVKARAEETRTWLEALRPFFVGVDALIDEQTKKVVAANKQIAEQKQRIADLLAANTAGAGEADIQSRRIALQDQYDAKAFHSFQDQLQHQQELAALDTEALQIKLAKADADLAAARALGDQVKIQQSLNEQASAQRAIDLQIEQSAANTAKLKREHGTGFNIAQGLNQQIDAFGKNAANSFADALVNTGKIGTAFKNALNQLETGALSVFVSAAFKRAVEASGLEALISKAFTKLFGAAGQGAQAASTAANTAAVTASTTATTATAAAMVTLDAEIIGLDASVTILDASIGILDASLAALTAAVIDQTVATWATGFLGFAGGGEPPVGVPSMVGEKGPELFIPKEAGSIIPADKTAGLMQSLGGLDLQFPSVPSFAVSGAASGSGSSYVTNKNVGSVGDMHFHVYGNNNPRETTRQIAQYLKQTFPTGSPFNIK